MGKKKDTGGSKVRPALPIARFGGDEEIHRGAGAKLFAEISDILGTSSPVVAGWCELDVDGLPRTALVLTQQWPFLPFGTDPHAVKKQQRYLAIVPLERYGLRAIEISPPPKDGAWKISQAGGA